jgi:hypothetical protein
MLRSRLLLLLMLPATLLLMAFRQSPLVDPPAITVAGNVAQDQVVKAIKIGLLHRGWVETASKPGEIDASLHLRDHAADIAIFYDAHAIQIKYVGSSNLKYETKRDGTRLIHTNYLSWIDNLVVDIKTELIRTGG